LALDGGDVGAWELTVGVSWMAIAMEQDEFADVVDVRFLDFEAVMLCTKYVSDLIEQTR